MRYKILENNGIENKNFDGGAFNNFTAGGKSGIILEVLDECKLLSQSNIITVSKGELLIKGIRVKIEENLDFPLTGNPAVETPYYIVAKVILNSDESILFDLFLTTEQKRTQENLYKYNSGIYELELGRFVHSKDGTIKNLQRTAEIIKPNSSSSSSGLTEEEKSKVDKIVTDGNGDKFLADNGEYKEIPVLYRHYVTFTFYYEDGDVINKGTLVIPSDSKTPIDNVEELRKYFGREVYAVSTYYGGVKGFSSIQDDTGHGSLTVTVGDIILVIYSGLSNELTTLVDNIEIPEVEAQKVDLTEYVKFTDTPTRDKPGVVKIGAGLYNNFGQILINPASDGEIEKFGSTYAPLTTTKIPLAVKAGLTKNPLTLTDEEKALAQNWLGIGSYQHYITYRSYYRLNGNIVSHYSGYIILYSSSKTLIETEEELRKYIGLLVRYTCAEQDNVEQWGYIEDVEDAGLCVRNAEFGNIIEICPVASYSDDGVKVPSDLADIVTKIGA